MNEKEIATVLKRAKEVFFKALLAGHTGGTEKKGPKLTTTHPMFDFKTKNTYHDGDFTVIDEWTTTDHSGVSFGTTTILFEKVPIWFMTYHGLYPKKSHPFSEGGSFRSVQERMVCGWSWTGWLDII